MVLTVPPLTTKESQHQGAVVNHPDAPFLIGIHGESWADDFAEISFLEDSGLLMLPRCASAFLKIGVGQGADHRIPEGVCFSARTTSAAQMSIPYALPDMNVE